MIGSSSPLVLGFLLAVAKTQQTCVDDEKANCTLYQEQKFCSLPYPADLKLSTCGVTCKMCGDAKCEDVSKNCPAYAQAGFCDDAGFPASIKVSQCAKTCGYCYAPLAPCDASDATCMKACGAGFYYVPCLNSCYRVLCCCLIFIFVLQVVTKEGGLNFNDADALCKEADSLLTSIHNAYENQIVNEIGSIGPTKVEGQTLIGGVRKPGGGKNDLEWLDNTPFVYKNFAPKQPDNLGGNQNCMKVWSSSLTKPKTPDYYGYNQWDDAKCSDKHVNAVCKKAAKPV